MAPSSVFHLTIFSTLVLTAILISFSATEASGGDSWMPMKPGCTGSIGECMEGNEFDMDSESNRRVLAATKFLTYEMLQNNNPPCSHRGASYQNCQQRAEANLYNRGCSAFRGCRS
ncbi:rapid alkalinization factor-like [Apium graveolens]|uniref:rapid alkalinization factor-like n=1 Tax=Apium graveolens TaxID=4045 RepID=UPI003D7BC91C